MDSDAAHASPGVNVKFKGRRSTPLACAAPAFPGVNVGAWRKAWPLPQDPRGGDRRQIVASDIDVTCAAHAFPGVNVGAWRNAWPLPQDPRGGDRRQLVASDIDVTCAAHAFSGVNVGAW